MTQSLTWWRALVASTIVLCFVFALGASGQSGKPAGVAFATVDVQKVTNEYKAMRVAQTELTARQGRWEAKINRRGNLPYLAEEKHKQIDDIEAKDPAARTAAETAKVKELADEGAKQSAEIDALRQKPDKDLSDADRQKLKDAETARAKAEQAVAALRDAANNDIREYGMANQERLTKEFRAAVKRVAEKKGIGLAFDMQYAVYAGADLTDEVLKDLNSK